MIHEHEATQLASAAMDFGLTPEVERELAAEYRDCPVCAERAAAYHEQIRLIQRLPVLDASDATRRRVTAAALSGRTGARSPWVLALAAALLLGLLLAMAAAAGALLTKRPIDQLTVVPPTASVAPSAAASGGPARTAAAPETPARPAPALAVDSVAEVVSSNLRVRSQPRVATDSEMYEPFLQPRDQLFVVAGPVTADRYDWYQVVPIHARGSRDAAALPMGWVAAADHDGTPWVSPAEPDCPEIADAEAVEAMAQLARVACFGGHAIDLPAILERGGDTGCPDGCPEAAWDQDWSGTSRSVRSSSAGFDVAFDPSAGIKPDDLEPGALVVLHGSFDRGAAIGCDADGPTPARELAEIAGCRSTFVVDKIRPDPSPLRPGSIATTVTSDLRVRSKPFVGDESAMLTPLLDNGTRLAVIDGPVLATGYAWYEVIVPSLPGPDSPMMVGWVAVAGRDGEPWAGPMELDCPDAGGLSVATLMELTAPPALDGGFACFGKDTQLNGGTLRIQGRIGVSCNEPGEVDDHDWLGLGKFNLIISDAGATIRGRPQPSLDASLACDAPPDPALYAIDGHFDDPAADACASDRPIWQGVPKYDNRIDLYACRSIFVVSRITPAD